MSQDRDDIVRHDDGTIDIRFYAQRAVALRRDAKAQFRLRAMAAIGRGWRALMRLRPWHRGGTGHRSPLAPSDPV